MMTILLCDSACNIGCSTELLRSNVSASQSAYVLNYVRVLLFILMNNDFFFLDSLFYPLICEKEKIQRQDYVKKIFFSFYCLPCNSCFCSFCEHKDKLVNVIYYINACLMPNFFSESIQLNLFPNTHIKYSLNACEITKLPLIKKLVQVP